MITVQKALDDYIADYERTAPVGDKTRRNWIGHLRDFAKFVNADHRRLDDLNNNDLYRYRSTMTIDRWNRRRYALDRFFKWVERQYGYAMPSAKGVAHTHRRAQRVRDAAQQRADVYGAVPYMVAPGQKIIFSLAFYYGYGIRKMIDLTYSEIVALPKTRELSRLIESAIRGVPGDAKPCRWWLGPSISMGNRNWRNWVGALRVTVADVNEVGSKERVARGILPSQVRRGDLDRGYFRALDADSVNELPRLWS